jgi:hypothetical protein
MAGQIDGVHFETGAGECHTKFIHDPLVGVQTVNDKNPARRSRVVEVGCWRIDREYACRAGLPAKKRDRSHDEY